MEQMRGKQVRTGIVPRSKPPHAGEPPAADVAPKSLSALDQRIACLEARRYGVFLFAEGYAVHIDSPGKFRADELAVKDVYADRKGQRGASGINPAAASHRNGRCGIYQVYKKKQP
ncbi:MAG: hypothetical protein M0Z58_03275 [Nitrospiraceae bacterium]|nr:hypothetical protein [Nitrospiraceae bacterium]